MNQETSPLPSDYGTLLIAEKERVRSAQYAALKAVNSELVGLYWDIGRMIVERQALGSCGKAVVQRLSEDLRSEFPGVCHCARCGMRWSAAWTGYGYGLSLEIAAVQTVVSVAHSAMSFRARI